MTKAFIRNITFDMRKVVPAYARAWTRGHYPEQSFPWWAWEEAIAPLCLRGGGLSVVGRPVSNAPTPGQAALYAVQACVPLSSPF